MLVSVSPVGVGLESVRPRQADAAGFAAAGDDDGADDELLDDDEPEVDEPEEDEPDDDEEADESAELTAGIDEDFPDPARASLR